MQPTVKQLRESQTVVHVRESAWITGAVRGALQLSASAAYLRLSSLRRMLT